MHAATTKRPRERPCSPGHSSGEEALAEPGREVRWGNPAGKSCAPRLYLSLCDKSISRAAVLHLHPARRGAAGAQLLPVAQAQRRLVCVRVRARACLIDFPSTFL